MNKLIIFYFCSIFIVLSCKVSLLSENKVFNELFNANEIKYTNIDKKIFTITNESKIKEFISIISKAKKGATVFIALEFFEIRMPKDNSIKMQRNKEFIKVNGISFLLSQKDNKKLNIFLERL